MIQNITRFYTTLIEIQNDNNRAPSLLINQSSKAPFQLSKIWLYCYLPVHNFCLDNQLSRQMRISCFIKKFQKKLITYFIRRHCKQSSKEFILNFIEKLLIRWIKLLQHLDSIFQKLVYGSIHCIQTYLEFDLENGQVFCNSHIACSPICTYELYTLNRFYASTSQFTRLSIY